MMGAVRFAGKYGKKIGGSLTEKSVNGRAFSNLYTGRDLNTKGMLLAGAGVAGYIGYQASEGQEKYYRDAALERGGDPNAIQSLPGTRADGQAYKPDRYAGPELEATGDLVFALHKIRHGG